MKASNNTMHV